MKTDTHPLSTNSGALTNFKLHGSIIFYHQSPVFLLPDEAGNVDMREGGHQVLAVESIHDASVARDGVSKVLQNRGGQVVIIS